MISNHYTADFALGLDTKIVDFVMAWEQINSMQKYNEYLSENKKWSVPSGTLLMD